MEMRLGSLPLCLSLSSQALQWSIVLQLIFHTVPKPNTAFNHFECGRQSFDSRMLSIKYSVQHTLHLSGKRPEFHVLEDFKDLCF